MRNRVLAVVSSSVALSLLALSAVRSQDAIIADPVTAYPDNYRVLFEDERVRVLEFRLAKGAREEFHRHPANVAVFLGEFKIRFRLPDGTTAMRDARLGDVAYSAQPVVHSPTNIGDTDARGILIELKEPRR